MIEWTAHIRGHETPFDRGLVTRRHPEVVVGGLATLRLNVNGMIIEPYLENGFNLFVEESSVIAFADNPLAGHSSLFFVHSRRAPVPFKLEGRMLMKGVLGPEVVVFGLYALGMGEFLNRGEDYELTMLISSMAVLRPAVGTIDRKQAKEGNL